MRTKKLLKGVSLGILACLMLCFVLVVPVLAASPAIHSIDIVVDLNDDGSALVTETWDVTIVDGTEYYLTKHGLLQGQTISNLVVTDETGMQYVDVGEWDSDRPKSEKAGQSGLISGIKGGYEICWGVGDNYGDHVYTVSYTMTGLLQGYGDADAINQTFVSRELASRPQQVNITVRADGAPFTQENTSVWGLGHTGEIYVEEGEVRSRSTSELSSSEYAAILVEFRPGMFHPVERNSKNFAEVLDDARRGSDYREEESGGVGSFFSNLGEIIAPLMVMLLGGLAVAGGAIGNNQKNKNSATEKWSKKQLDEVPYSRNLPWKGSLRATYKRLEDIGQLQGESDIIGAYLLRWMRSNQVALLPDESGGKNTDYSLQLYSARPDMEAQEKALYNMLLTASANNNYVLRGKMFEKWCKTNYQAIQGWLQSYKNAGMQEMRHMGAFANEQAKMMGIFSYTKTVPTPVGQQLTSEMVGFGKYLKDFTIINEREAREVQLWDEYLVFAQVFGIAEVVAQQFSDLYPDYFVNYGSIGTGTTAGMTYFDMMRAIHFANYYSRVAHRGYQAGYKAAHTSSFSGGGGGFSGGGGFGGGGFSSSGGGGTR